MPPCCEPDAYSSMTCTFPRPPSWTTCSTWPGVITKIKSASETIAGVSFRARCPVRSSSRSIPTSSASSVAVALSHALVPALETLTSEMPRRLATFLANASAIALRHVLPLQTKSRFMSGVADEIWYALSELGRGYRARPNDAWQSSRAIDDRRRLGLFEATPIENPERAARDRIAPLSDDLIGGRGGRNAGSVGAG